MVVAKIVVKDNYENKNDLVLRSYIRALQKIGDNPYLDDNKGLVYGIVDQNNNFYEILTGKYIPYKNYDKVDNEELESLISNVSKEMLDKIYEIIRYVLFKEECREEFYEMEELNNDRAIDFEAYNNNLIAHNPYSVPYDGYNDFIFKCREVEKVKKKV